MCGTQDGSIAGGSALFGLGSDYESENGENLRRVTVPKRQKIVATSTSGAAIATKTKTPSKREKKSLSLLLNMPLDVLFEILGQLTPKDLLNVSRTNKVFHKTLLSRSAKSVWKCALRNEGVTECPNDLIEPQWARLLFGTSCESCGTTNVLNVDFYIRRRICNGCKKTSLFGKARIAKYFPKCDEIILKLIPFTNVGGWGKTEKFYWKDDIQEIIQIVGSYNGNKRMSIFGVSDELKTFIQQRMCQVREIHAAAAGYQTWYKQAALNRYKEANASKYNRLQAIHAKFLELGYSEQDLSFLPYENECCQKAALTDTIWKRIRPILELRIEEEREQREFKEGIVTSVS
ncbi:hypothetical protein BDN70DRAFT_882128 [Pholiota conissans]|uniref:F-box domain-containing protein n=1 Tax=Pholiota conissans TaxID=109636 RepID=A0A9P6CYI1_9AGAR|nr:hypothetical protein BDN70DRAFT_882128 [Pholiota conissans]